VEPFLAAYKAHRLERETQIIEQIKAGRGRIADMVPVIYAAVDPRLHAAAAHSVLAHIIHLERQGMIASDGSEGSGAVYSLA